MQIFRPGANTIATLLLASLGVMPVLAVGLAYQIVQSPHVTNQDVTRDQPVPFSHEHHVGDAGIECRYCHAAVEESAFAGIPAVSTCMTCHSQLYTDQPALSPLIGAARGEEILRWQRLHKLPDFVYFNHSIHIAKGVGCATCHGAVDEMALTARVAPLTMQWCLACHRNPAPYLRPRDAVFDQHWTRGPEDKTGPQLLLAYGIDTRRLADCSICHR